MFQAIVRRGVTFTKWLSKQRGRDDAIGDLAEDARCDRHKPLQDGIGPTCVQRLKDKWLVHLHAKHACTDAIATFRQAFAIYEEFARWQREEYGGYGERKTRES